VQCQPNYDVQGPESSGTHAWLIELAKRRATPT
jgi:hypothetical protein